MEWLDRLGLRTRLARDVALAVAVGAATAAFLVPATGVFAADLDVHLGSRQRVLLVALAVAQALALCLRRVRAPLCLLLVAALQALLTVTASSQATVHGVATVVAAYSAGTCLRVRRLLRWGALAVAVEIAGTVGLGAATGHLRPGAWSGYPSVWTWLLAGASVAVLYLVAAAGGVAVATRRENLALLEARALAAEEAQAREARRAVEAERLRMARELHDVAAHHLTGLLVQASAAERLVDRDAAGARTALREVRNQGKQALDNLRAVVGMLRQDSRPLAPTRSPAAGEPAEELDPVPGLTVLEDLVATARGLGDRVELEVTGTPYALAPVADVTAYRVTQEALSNARQHAPAQPVRVAVAYAEAGLLLTVDNPVPDGEQLRSDRHGFGLAGMHERAVLVGGSLDAGPVGALWRVALRVPREEPAVLRR